ncbi:MAG: hypothetical protein KGZ83_13550 [Sulfuricella sp.]|nr:hypothetical protein [Sulfuricella sp.]
MNKSLLLLAAALCAPLVQAVTLAPAVENRNTAAAEYSAAPFERGAASLPPRYEGHDGVSMYSLISQLDSAAIPATPVVGALKPQDGVFAFGVDLGALPGNPELGYDGQSQQFSMRYVMTGNHVTEGWNWTPLADLQTTDYYRYKFLPLKDVTVEKTPSDVWKYEYMVTFANLYDFYPRSSDDAAGFAATLALPQAEALRLMQGNLRMLAVCRLAPPWHTQSSTFWKATDTAPYDYMLKKRYLYAELLEVWFYDYSSGKVLAKLKPLK